MTGPMLGAVRQFSAALPGGPVRPGAVPLRPLRPRLQGHPLHRAVQRPPRAAARPGPRRLDLPVENKDFLTSTDYDFHPTDVLEDADGSLLVVDMGAWFNYGCPTSKIAKPEVLGAIYRVRRADSAAPTTRGASPWGSTTMGPADLAARLDDPRPKVRDRAVERLVALGAGAVPALSALARGGGRRPGVAPGPPQRALGAGADRHARGASGRPRRRSATRTPGCGRSPPTWRAWRTTPRRPRRFEGLVVQDRPPVRLKAAEALGRIGRAGAVPALLDGRPQGGRRPLPRARPDLRPDPDQRRGGGPRRARRPQPARPPRGPDRAGPDGRPPADARRGLALARHRRPRPATGRPGGRGPRGDVVGRAGGPAQGVALGRPARSGAGAVAGRGPAGARRECGRPGAGRRAAVGPGDPPGAASAAAARWWRGRGSNACRPPGSRPSAGRSSRATPRSGRTPWRRSGRAGWPISTTAWRAWPRRPGRPPSFGSPRSTPSPRATGRSRRRRSHSCSTSSAATPGRSCRWPPRGPWGALRSTRPS